MPSIAEILGPEKVKAISTTKFDSPDTPELIKKRNKYKPYSEMLENNPELRNRIESVFGTVQAVPAVHITSKTIKLADAEVPTGFVDSILSTEFRAQDTNVGIFMKRDGKRGFAKPSEFVDGPEKFLRELEVLLRHYYRHGTRTNKNILDGELKDGVGVPVMLLVDVDGIKLEKGSDYEDHYRLGTSVPGSRVIGEIDLEGLGPEIKKRLPEIAAKFLDLTESYNQKHSNKLTP